MLSSFIMIYLIFPHEGLRHFPDLLLDPGRPVVHPDENDQTARDEECVVLKSKKSPPHTDFGGQECKP